MYDAHLTSGYNTFIVRSRLDQREWRMSKHDTFREGATLGLIVATVTWLWIAVVDLMAGRPSNTFDAFGGVGPFTAVHYLLNVLYSVVIVLGIRGSERAPSLFIAVIFGLVMMQVGFTMLTAILAVRLGGLAWVLIFGGSLIGLAIAMVLLNRKYSFSAHLRRAEEER
jgi:hypothetical protein